jgi:protease-4
MGQFIKQTFASLIGTIAGLILFLVLGTGALVVLIVSSAIQDTGPTVKNQSMLVFDLSTQIKDTKPPSSLSEALSEEEIKVITLRQVLDALESASKDDRIIGIFLDGRGGESGNGFANLTEVRTALERFRATGKKVIAYDVNLSEKEYYLASVANSIVLNPMGTMEINGIGTQSLFMAGALEKYGIGVQVIRVGSYKAAVEPFIRKDLSPENRQQTTALLGNIWNSFLGKVSESRQITGQQLQKIADNQGILTPNAAKNAKLVDQLGYYDQVVTDLQKLTGKTENGQSFQQISLEKYAEVAAKNAKSSSNKIALVYAEGEIVDGQGTVDNIGGEKFAQELRKIRENKDIKAVVLRVNSPGGSATASEIIWREVQLISEKKPVVISMGNVAASGGYWISTGAKYIFAEPNSITGSIGVFGLLFNVEEVAQNNGITWDGVKTAKLADFNSSVRPKTEAELAIYQKYVEQVYTLFIEKVAKARNLPPDKVREIAQGRVWAGEDAKKIGLVDEIGGLDAAIRYVVDEANLGQDWQIEEYPTHKTFEAELIERLLSSRSQDLAKTDDPLTIQLLKLQKDLKVFQTFNDPQSVYAYLPFNWQIK